MKEHIFPAIRLTLACFVLFSGIYTLAVLGIAQWVPGGGKGETLNWNNHQQYRNIGQSFTQDHYFWSRPSAAGYNAAASCGSNKALSNPAYQSEIRARIDTFMAHNPGVLQQQIPADLLTASGSGLDPHISAQGALVQVQRIAKVRKMDIRDLEMLVEQQTEAPLAGLFGTERVNVLKLNIALDQIAQSGQ